jgi:hypothetical protein
MEQKDIVQLIELTLNELRLQIGEHNYAQIAHFLQYNELKLSVEFLCEHIAEDQIELKSAQKSQITTLCSLLKLDKVYWPK